MILKVDILISSFFKKRGKREVGFWKQWFSKKETLKTEEKINSYQKTVVDEEDNFVRLGIAVPVNEEERELISVITSAVIGGHQGVINFKIRNVYAIDEEKEIAAMMACILAGESQKNSNVRLVSIKQI